MTRASLRSVGDDVAWLVTREVPPDVDAFYLGVEPFCMQCSAAVSILRARYSPICSCALFFSEGDSWASVYVSRRR